MSVTIPELVARAKLGDMEAFDEIVKLKQERVYALAYRVMGNADDASDIQQETFVRAWKSLRQFRGEAGFTTWLHRITLNMCLSKKRKKHPITVGTFSDDDWTSSFTSNGMSCIERTETSMLLKKALAEMPAHYRILIVLKDLEQRSFEEIAELLKCSLAGARTRASRARHMLREKIRPYFAEE